MNEHDAKTEFQSGPVRWRRQWVAVLVVSHLCLTFVANALGSRLTTNWAHVLSPLVFWGIWGLHIGQSILLACWGAFATQAWFWRIPRFLSLAAWLFLVEVLGLYVAEGDIVTTIVEELAALQLLFLLPPLLILLAWRLWSRRGISRASDSQVRASQFGILQLLLITAEAAALLAIGRIVLRWNKNAAEEFWAGLTGNLPEELIPLVVSVAILPAVFCGLSRRHTWPRLLILTLYLTIPSYLWAWAQTTYHSRSNMPSSEQELWSILLVHWRNYFCGYMSAAATILFTFYLLRRIGYDFRRRDEPPRGRSSSSNACNSAASASA
jgi:hypothetical protein